MPGRKSREVFSRLTRHKISDRWRGRVWLLVECGSHRKLERGAASGSLHRLVRLLCLRPCPWRILYEFRTDSSES